ncbi:hypothetical protein Pfo_010560 [Paulownia fortunei]|nr:hypothetical protein Pfo_010560 [Paulownia fortunei]
MGGHLFALCESDLPYAVKVTAEGDIITLGRHDFQSNEPFLRMTAHPKIDQVTGEAKAYGYDVRRPFLTFFRVDSQGRKQKGVPILSMEECTAIHDFGLTKNYLWPVCRYSTCSTWEEDGGNTTIMVASNIVSIEHMFENTELSQLTLEKITINVKANTVQRHRLSAKTLDLGTINPASAAKKNRTFIDPLLQSNGLAS